MKKANRLSTSYEFNKTRRFGKKFRSKLFDIFYFRNPRYDGPARLGVVVSNKFNPVAPKRNRVKRLFREVLRLQVEKIPNGYWVVVHPLRASLDSTYEEIRAEFNKVLSKISFSD